jgi:hypothetical protein
MTKARTFLWAALGTALLALGAVPGAHVPIIGDDLQALFETYAVAHGSFGEALTFGWGQGLLAGHFNPVGQAIGAGYHFGAFTISSQLGVSPQYYDVVVGGFLLWLAVAGAASLLTWGLRSGGVREPVSFWRVFALLSAVTAATVQLHPWSNDPVTSFGPAGWGSAAIGFALLALATRATMPLRKGWGDFVLIGGVAVFAVLYYEMLVGMIAGSGVIYALALLRARSRQDRAGFRRISGLSVVGVVLPAAVFIGGRLLAIPAAKSNYTGTTIAFGPQALGAWRAAMVGALPAGGWPYLFRMSRSVELTPRAMFLALLICLGVGALLAAWSQASRITVVWTRSSAILLGTVVATWALTTATHTTTPKYIDEIKEPGLVYLYYAVAVICVAILISWAILVLAPRAPSAVRVIALVLLGMFLVVQVSLNLRLAAESAGAFAPNGVLGGAAVSETATEDSRCAALVGFAEHPWPQYYRDAITKDAQIDYQSVFGKPFCSDQAALARVAAAKG